MELLDFVELWRKLSSLMLGLWTVRPGQLKPQPLVHWNVPLLAEVVMTTL